MKYFNKADRFRKEAKALKRKEKRGIQLTGHEKAKLKRRIGQCYKAAVVEVADHLFDYESWTGIV
jgi:hypothetical protein